MQTIKTKKQNYILLKLSIILFTTLGLAISLYLASIHYKNYTDLNYQSFCAISKAINCDTVSQSPWSLLFDIPLAYWGFFSYIYFLYFFILYLKSENKYQYKIFFLKINILLGIIYSFTSIYLYYISSIKINAYCILCIGTYAINFYLTYSCWLLSQRVKNDNINYLKLKRYINKNILKYIYAPTFSLIFIMSFIHATLPKYWDLSVDVQASDLDSGLTNNNNPWLGSKNPILTIHEYTDYLCFQCNKMHHYLRKLVQSHPDKLRIVHHNYPMDNEFNPLVVSTPLHEGSGKMALLGIYAAAKNKFWVMNDALYTLGRKKTSFNTQELAQLTGFTSSELVYALKQPELRKYLSADIHQGMKLRILGTPTFVIDGKVYPGVIPAEILQPFL